MSQELLSAAIQVLRIKLPADADPLLAEQVSVAREFLNAVAALSAFQRLPLDKPTQRLIDSTVADAVRLGDRMLQLQAAVKASPTLQ